jgi:lon-related putative ATP-dependent protease
MNDRSDAAATALPWDALSAPCDPARLGFANTDDLAATDATIVGQDRAVEAIAFAIGMPHGGFNLFALGEEGTGRATLVRRSLAREAEGRPPPSDWCYVNNFVDHRRPKALRLPAGRGRALVDDMKRLIEELTIAIPAAFESDDYRNRKSAIQERFKERHEKAFATLQEKAREREIALIRTPMGLALAPIKGDEVLDAKEFEALPEKEREKRRAAMEELQTELEEILRSIPRIERAQREKVRELNREVTQSAVGHLIDDLKLRWRDQPGVTLHLDAVRDDMIENAHEFLPQEGGVPPAMEALMAPAARRALQTAGPAFRRYQVNLLVDNAPADGAPSGVPVIEEDHPTQPNLIGRVEHLAQFGALVTDFNLIKGGALHRANGGYLILSARKVLMQPFAWESLKRALRTGRIRIESLGEEIGWASTVTLEPEPIPLEIKVVLIGEPILYYLLHHYDPEFRELFKVAADFDDRLARDAAGEAHYARLVATVAKTESLAPFDASAVARVVEHGARMADDQKKLSARIEGIADLVREAAYWARRAEVAVVTAEHVEKAIAAGIYRSDRLRALIQEAIKRGTLVIETAGAKSGQVNGLSVIQLDNFRFGRPSRITCRVAAGKGEVADIEREVDLGGPLHSKGVMILSSFLNARYGRDQPLSLNASLVFEQSYGGVEGDSASSAELYALMSALADIPIKQSLAVTGSVDQLGRVQAIGGVNEKIEGFFDICAARGLTGDEGVLIPKANVEHLMLRRDVIEAVKAGRFRVFAVETVDDGIGILTGIPAGEADADGAYPVGSVNARIVARLASFARKARARMLRERGPEEPGEKSRRRP